MSERRGESQIRKEIHGNAKSALSGSTSTVGLHRSAVIGLYTIAEILLDIREHLDSIDARMHL